MALSVLENTYDSSHVAPEFNDMARYVRSFDRVDPPLDMVIDPALCASSIVFTVLVSMFSVIAEISWNPCGMATPRALTQMGVIGQQVILHGSTGHSYPLCIGT